MKIYIVTKKGKQTKIMADSIEEAIEIYNDLLVKDTKKIEIGDIVKIFWNRTTHVKRPTYTNFGEVIAKDGGRIYVKGFDKKNQGYFLDFKDSELSLA